MLHPLVRKASAAKRINILILFSSTGLHCWWSGWSASAVWAHGCAAFSEVTLCGTGCASWAPADSALCYCGLPGWRRGNDSPWRKHQINGKRVLRRRLRRYTLKFTLSGAVALLSSICKRNFINRVIVSVMLVSVISTLLMFARKLSFVFTFPVRPWTCLTFYAEND